MNSEWKVVCISWNAIEQINVPRPSSCFSLVVNYIIYLVINYKYNLKALISWRRILSFWKNVYDCLYDLLQLVKECIQNISIHQVISA